MNKPDLLEFIKNKMSMSDIYQPVVIKELLLHNGVRTKEELATALATYDTSVQEYYERIVMRWPKSTLTKHEIVEYSRQGRAFQLLPYPKSEQTRNEAVRICKEKIENWLERKKSREPATAAGASVRYEILKSANGKCELCGISSKIRPIDIDHIVPRSKANRNGKVRLHDRLIDVNDRENLQALCFACNRAKRDTDTTDFRRRNKLVRDRIPDLIQAEGRKPLVKVLSGKKFHAALFDKLQEEHAELLAANDQGSRLDELADLVEVIFALAEQDGADEEMLLSLVREKRETRGGFSKAYFYLGDDAT